MITVPVLDRPGVAYGVWVRVMGSSFCYCLDCQEAHQCLGIEAAAIGADSFKWTKGEDQLISFNRTEHEQREAGKPGA